MKKRLQLGQTVSSCVHRKGHKSFFKCYIRLTFFETKFSNQYNAILYYKTLQNSILQNSLIMELIRRTKCQ